jgi:hypothetical protein
MKDCVDVSAPVAADGSLDELNRWLGRREAFGLMAGRCSAADVECMRRMREDRLYLGRSATWAEFCNKYLHMGKSNANRLIGMLEKFGPEYFHIVQITRISPADYRVIAPAVSGKGIKSKGEMIPLTPENSERIGVAVQSLLASKTNKEDDEWNTPLIKLQDQGNRLLKRLRDLSQSDPDVKGAVALLKLQFEELWEEVM